MIPLAQCLAEFDDDEGIPFDGKAASVNGHAGAPRPMVFETLMLVEPVANETKPALSSPIHPIEEAVRAVLMQRGGQAGRADGSLVSETAVTTADQSPQSVAEPEPEPLVAPQIDHEAQRAEAAAARAEEAARAREAVDVEIAAAVEAARAEERQNHEVELDMALALARDEWTTTQGTHLATCLFERMDRVQEIVRASLASVLRPLVTDARRRQSVLELADAANLLIGDGRALSLKASGPADLLAALSEALGSRSEMVTCSPDETASDLRIVCDDTVVETRLKGWHTALEEALS